MRRDQTIAIGVIIALVASFLFIAMSMPSDVGFVDDYGTDYGVVLAHNYEEGTGDIAFDQSPYGHDGNFSAIPGSMEQVLIAGYYNELHTTATEYNVLSGGFGWHGTELTSQQIVSTDGVIKSLRVKLDGTPGEGNHYTFTLLLNGAPSAITFDISNDETSGSDMIHEIDIAPGDTISLECDPDSNPTARYATWSSIFESEIPYESLILGNTGPYSINRLAAVYCQVQSAASIPSADETIRREVCPTSGTLKNLYVKVDEDFGTDPDAYKFTIRKNGEDQALTVTITADDTTGFDIVNSVDVVAGDVLTFIAEPIGEMLISPSASWGLTFEADINGESILMGGTWDSPDNTDTEYITMTGREQIVWTVTEAQRTQLGQECTLKKLHILLDGAPGAGNSYDFTARIAGADSNVVASVDGLDTTGDSGALEDMVGLDDYLDLKSVPISIPDIRDAYWGIVSYIVGSLEKPTWTTGKYGSALEFSTGEYIDVGNVTTTLRTLETWIYLDTTTEPLFSLSSGVDISVSAGALTATGFSGTPTYYVNGEEASTVTSETWTHIAVTSNANENCTDFTIAKVGADYLGGKVDQLRLYTEEKTEEEVGVQYLNVASHMYSGSVTVSDNFRILNTTLDEVLGLDDSGLDLHHNYILNSDFSHWIQFIMAPGQTDVSINVVPSGILTQDRHFHRLTFAVDTAPGAGDECNITLTDGVGSMFISLSDAETSDWTETGKFDWDVSEANLVLKYSQSAGGAARKGFITIKYHYMETP